MVFLTLLVLVLPVLPGSWTLALAASAPVPFATETLSPEALAAATAPRTLGDPSAPVTLTEYSSLSCSHCARFHAEVFSQIKADYIDTGKVRFTYQDLPTSPPGLAAAMLARCLPATRHEAALTALFASQKDWAFAHDWQDKVRAQGAALGVQDMGACLASPGLRAAIVAGAEKAGADFGIDATPSFVINGETVIRGEQSYAEFAKALDAALDALPARP